MCMFTVKSIIKYYTGHNTPVYTCFHDASKAFDRVNHWTLSTKLIYSGISLLIVNESIILCMLMIFAWWHLLALQCRIWLMFATIMDLQMIFLINPLKSVCIVYKPKYGTLFCPSVNIGSEPLRFVNETNYLGFTFCSLNKVDRDILRQMRSVYARSNRILRMFSHCSIDVKIVLFHSYCTPLYCS